jgi:hypothetical protein
MCGCCALPVSFRIHLKPGFIQGDQIWRIFAYWVIAYLLWKVLFENYRSSPNFKATFSMVKRYSVEFDKNELGYIFGDFFTNASGRPGFITYIHLFAVF